MEIGKITLTTEELHDAVQSWLASKGLKVAVACVQKTSYGRGPDWEVTSVAENAEIESVPASMPKSVTRFCIHDNCSKAATPPQGVGDGDTSGYYCDEHKHFCDATDCIERIPMAEQFCNLHKEQPAPPTVSVEPPF